MDNGASQSFLHKTKFFQFSRIVSQKNVNEMRCLDAEVEMSWQAGQLTSWLAGLAGWLAGLAGWLAGWLAGQAGDVSRGLSRT